MAEVKQRKTDRRTLYTREVIKDAFLELIAQMPFDRVNVTKVCERAEISRATFYLHYETLDRVLDSVIDDALLFSEEGKSTLIDSLDMAKQGKSAKARETEGLLPACQRIADSKKYHCLFMDNTLEDHIIRRISAHERDAVVPSLMEKGGLSQEDAEMIFRFILHGSFAVNRSLGWCKGQRWYLVQDMLAQFINRGLRN